jgi:hypothetical protein
MHYPPEFSTEARAAVEAEFITAGRSHAERKRQWKTDWPFPQQQSLTSCILSIFLTYAREAIELGRRGLWSMDKVREEALEGLRLITLQVSHKWDYDFFTEGNSGYISRATQREFEATATWEQFEDELLALAKQHRRQDSEPPKVVVIDPFADSSGRRPLGDNPYTKEDARHRTFEKASWEAEKDLADLKLELFRRFDASTKAPAEVLKILLTYRLTRFDLIAMRVRQNVDDADTARRFEDWLRAFGAFEFDDILSRLKLPTPDFPNGLLPLLDLEGFRLKLMQKVEQHNAAALSIVEEMFNETSERDSGSSRQDGVASPDSVPASSGIPPNDSESTSDGPELPKSLEIEFNEFLTSVRGLESIDVPTLARALQPLADAVTVMEDFAFIESRQAFLETLEASACALEGLDPASIASALESIKAVSEVSSSLQVVIDEIAANLDVLQNAGVRILAGLDQGDLDRLLEPVREAGRAARAIGAATHEIGPSALVEPPSGVQESGPQLDTAPVPNRTATAEELIDAYLRAHPEIPDHQTLADQIGISRDVLFAIKRETRWVRSVTYGWVAILIGCSKDDLHPRQMARKRRKRKSNAKANSNSNG